MLISSSKFYPTKKQTKAKEGTRNFLILKSSKDQNKIWPLHSITANSCCTYSWIHMHCPMKYNACPEINQKQFVHILDLMSCPTTEMMTGSRAVRLVKELWRQREKKQNKIRTLYSDKPMAKQSKQTHRHGCGFNSSHCHTFTRASRNAFLVLYCSDSLKAVQR